MKNFLAILRSFPRVFWIANIMELFERAAYYGMNSVLAIYLTDSIAKGGLGFSEESVGFLQGLIYAIVYVVPILGGALADRYGYRRMLMIAFSLLAFGYFLSGYMSSYGAVFSALLVMATGAGLFKPIVSGTLARTTTEDNSGFGFGIFYWMINMGAFLAPLVVSYIKGFSWQAVFATSALYCALMLIPTVFFYRDPHSVSSKKNLRDVVAGAAIVLADARFMLMIFMYSTFWILYFQNFGSVLWYLRDFIDATPINMFFASYGIPFKFDAEHVTVINAGTIILLQVIVSRLVKNLKPLPTMVTGVLLGAVGFFFLSMGATISLFVIGIIIFSIGEMTAHPKYLSYVGLVAPADKKAIYMGYAFLYGVVGSLIGSNIGGVMYEAMMKPLIGQEDIQGDIRMFWLIFSILGLISAAGLIFYNRYFSADTPQSNARARLIVLGIYLALVAIGLFFVVQSTIIADTIQFRTIIQALILLVIGGIGFGITIRNKHSAIGS
jgi:dipeptide/tripeptide permease